MRYKQYVHNTYQGYGLQLLVFSAQVEPLNPSLHIQVKVSPLLTHVELFKHGDDEHELFMAEKGGRMIKIVFFFKSLIYMSINIEMAIDIVSFNLHATTIALTDLTD